MKETFRVHFTERAETRRKPAKTGSAPGTRSSRRLRRVHLSLWILGAALLFTAVALAARGSLLSSQDVRAFHEARRLAPVALPDFGDWSPNRIAAYDRALPAKTGLPIAVLRIPSIELEVAVHSGTDERTLDRAVGWIEGTARPGEAGNVGLAGHRDGFFRGLREIAEGDRIYLETLDGVLSYEVERHWVVSPDQVEVLAPTDGRALTLVTCFPFYYVGSAPERFIVRGRYLGFDSYTVHEGASE